MNSLIDMISELELSFPAVTETGFKRGMQLKQELGDIEQATGIKVLYRNRDGRKKTRGGGVALAFRTGACPFKERKIKKAKTLKSSVGNVGRINRKVVVFVLYIPPNTTASQT